MSNGWFTRTLLVSTFLCGTASAQTAPSSTASPSPRSETYSDTRSTPRGTVLGFLAAARNGDYEMAKRYLDNPKGVRPDSIARQLSVVLDRRLPARLNELSPLPEGSQQDPDRPDTELVGRIDSLDGPVDITLNRLERGKSGKVWLFSKETLNAIPELYTEVNHVSPEELLPAFLTQHRIAHITLLQWLWILAGMPLIYTLTGLLDRLLTGLFNGVRSRRRPGAKAVQHVVPKPVRLLLLVLIIRLAVANLNIPLLSRLFWSTVATLIAIGACVWLLLIFNARAEEYSRRRLGRRGIHGAVSILRLARRTIDLLIVFAGALVLLSYFNLNVTAALAGLGVGGIAIALAAQKTLENVIGGISLIADKVVRVGDFLKIGDTSGTVEAIGLRSTRIRTLDRSIVSIPNSQISNERLEDLSCRDKFWFHPVLSLQYDTSGTQVRAVLSSIRNLLLHHPRVQEDSVRVRFLRFGISSLDVEAVAYISVLDFSDFLEVQEELLLRVMDAVQAAGTRMALPSQTTYVASTSAFDGNDPSILLNAPARVGSA